MMCLKTTAARKRLGSDLCDQLLSFVAEHGWYLSELEGQSRLVHSDFNGSNILVRQASGRWQISAVLDWEFAHSGTPLFDVGSMLRYRKKLSPGFQAGFTSEFQKCGGVLPSNWQRMVRLLDLCNLVEPLCGERERQWLFDEIRGLIVDTIADWSELTPV